MIKCAKCGSASVRRSHDGLSIVCGYCGQPITTERTRVPEPGRISAAECEKCAKDLPGTSISRPLLTRAAATIRALEQDRDAARSEAVGLSETLQSTQVTHSQTVNLLRQQLSAADDMLTEAAEVHAELRKRAEKAEDALAALRAETADLLEVERCKASIEAAGHGWGNTFRGDLHVYDRHDDLAFIEEFDKRCATWPEAERAAWEHAAAPYRARVEAVGWTLTIRDDHQYPDCDSRPIMLTWSRGSSSEIEFFGDPGSSPTLEALEAAAAWAEAHPANPPAALDSSEQKVCSCGHVHDGCEGCADELTSYAQDPCRKCRNLHTPEECRYTPAPQETCPYCGKRCAND